MGGGGGAEIVGERNWTEGGGEVHEREFFLGMCTRERERECLVRWEWIGWVGVRQWMRSSVGCVTCVIAIHLVIAQVL